MDREQLQREMKTYFSVQGRAAHFIAWAKRNYNETITPDQISNPKNGKKGFSSFSSIVFQFYLSQAEQFNGNI